MSDWPKQVPVEQTSEDKLYFIARTFSQGRGFDYWSLYLSGKEGWSVKPGIAMRFYGGAALVKTFAKNPQANLVAIEVPADADKRWRARKHRIRSGYDKRH